MGQTTPGTAQPVAQQPALPTPNSIPSPLPQIRSMEANVPGQPNSQNRPLTEQTKTGKYSEYQSYCRSNQYDAGFEYSRFLTNDAVMKEVKELIDTKKYYDAEKYILANRQKLGDQNYYQSLILVYGLKKNFVQAFAWVDRATAENQKDFAIKRLAAVAYELQNNFIEGKMLIQDLYKSTKNAAILEDLCRMNALDSQHRDAEISCDTALKKMPNNFLVPIWLGVSYREREMFDEAKVEFENSLKIKPSEFALTCLAELETLRKNKPAAISYFEKAIQFNPKSVRAQIGLAKIYFEEHKYEKALEHFKSSCQLGLKDRIDFRKAYKELTVQKNPIAEKYISAIQECP